MIDGQKALIFVLLIILDFHSQIIANVIKDLGGNRVSRPYCEAEDGHSANVKGVQWGL